ncbi:hypothetical protein ILUMI_19916 [Ignelater luminosus]|uniref:Uncharacterized protein n=1 Tax=Ignelater luminosus TaxID=2038154 RepID=A0A8K0G2R8_IGNLU|nr:hypothetical protein ILUMI_19916 [Ignelater luminosus]
MLKSWGQLMLVAILFKEYITLPEYHQNDYDVQIERVEVVWTNTSIARDAKLNYVFYNRSQKAFNASVYLLVNLSTDMTGVVQFYRFASNEYREFPMRVGANLCHEYAKNNFNVKELLKNRSNLIDCPLPKGYYYVRYLVPDYSRLPPYIPRGRYKAVGKVYHKSQFIAEANAYVAVVDKPLKWNKWN